MEGLNFRQANPPLSVSDCVRLTNRLNAPPRTRAWNGQAKGGGVFSVPQSSCQRRHKRGRGARAPEDHRSTLAPFGTPQSLRQELHTKHSADEREMLGSYVDDRNIENVRTSVRRVLDALWQMLSGVCRRHPIAC